MPLAQKGLSRSYCAVSAPLEMTWVGNCTDDESMLEGGEGTGGLGCRSRWQAEGRVGPPGAWTSRVNCPQQQQRSTGRSTCKRKRRSTARTDETQEQAERQPLRQARLASPSPGILAPWHCTAPSLLYTITQPPSRTSSHRDIRSPTRLVSLAPSAAFTLGSQMCAPTAMHAHMRTSQPAHVSGLGAIW